MYVSVMYNKVNKMIQIIWYSDTICRHDFIDSHFQYTEINKQIGTIKIKEDLITHLTSFQWVAKIRS